MKYMADRYVGDSLVTWTPRKSEVLRGQRDRTLVLALSLE